MGTRADFRHSFRVTLILSATFAFCAGLMISCSNANFEQAPPKADTKGICIPGGGGGGNATNGLVGNLYYLDDSQPRYTQALQYMQYGHKIPTPLFLNRLYTPSVKFERGFVDETGQSLKRDDGQVLHYNFGFQLWSLLQLNGSNPTGNYQLAIISDDGAILTLKEGASESTYINGDGYNSSRLHCGNRPVRFDAATRMPMRLEYFQGPPTHIALILMWRPWPADNNWQDPLCGQQGDNFYFDTNQVPSQPTSNWNALIARGWRPLENSNFALPDGQTNPCTQQ